MLHALTRSPLRPRLFLLVLVATVAAFVSAHRALAEPASLCASLPASPRGTSIVAFQPPSSFALCFDGHSESSVVAGRPVYLELLPSPSTTLFEFRVPGRALVPRPSGLHGWSTDASTIAHALRDLTESGLELSAERPDSSPPSSRPLEPRPPAPLAPNPGHAPPPPAPVVAAAGGAAASPSVERARALYLGVVTPRFHRGVEAIDHSIDTLPTLATTLGHWCKELEGKDILTAEARDALTPACAGPELADGLIDHEVAKLATDAANFRTARDAAREALVVAETSPTDAAAQTAASSALDAARASADRILADANELAPEANALSRDALVLREALRSFDALRPGVPVFLASYPEGGIARLEIEARPVGLLGSVGPGGGAPSETSRVTYRVPVVSTHYLDFDAGFGVTRGLPPIPGLTSQGGMQVITGRPVDEFVGLGLVELEPARFLYPDSPLAGILRLPVVGIPFTRDPTQNFFVGAALGWTGVGDVAFGPYLLREATLTGSNAIGGMVSNSTNIQDISRPKLQIGYFLTANIDLVGLFHLAFPPHTPTFDAVTGNEER